MESWNDGITRTKTWLVRAPNSMNLFHSIAAIVTIISIYSLGIVFWIVASKNYSDLSQHVLKSNMVSSISQVQRVFTPYEHEFPCFEQKNVKST